MMSPGGELYKNTTSPGTLGGRNHMEIGGIMSYYYGCENPTTTNFIIHKPMFTLWLHFAMAVKKSTLGSHINICHTSYDNFADFVLYLQYDEYIETHSMFTKSVSLCL